MKETLKEIAETLKAAHDATEGVAVSGAGVDRLAAARQLMRKAYQTAQTALKEEATDG